jgi:MFS family permease
MLMMGASTFLIGLLPTYDQIGILAPIALLMLRLVQGFAVAGESTAASAMILEHAPFGRRGYYGSYVLHGIQAGQLLAAGASCPYRRSFRQRRSWHGAGDARSCSVSSWCLPATLFVGG